MAEDEMKQIEMFTLPELMEEVAKRVDEFIFLGRIQTAQDQSRRLSMWKGSPCTCLGIAKKAETLFEVLVERELASDCGWDKIADDDDFETDDEGAPIETPN